MKFRFYILIYLFKQFAIRVPGDCSGAGEGEGGEGRDTLNEGLTPSLQTSNTLFFFIIFSDIFSVLTAEIRGLNEAK